MKIEEKQLPNGWEVRKLGEVCNIQTGKYDANHAKSAGKFRFYTCAFDYMFCDTNRFKGESIILPGNGANVGEVFYFDGEFDAYQRTYVLNSFDKVYSKFLFYHLLCYWRKLNQDKQFGSATNYIRMGNFTDYEVPIPPLSEQQAIVAKIEELFSELENGKQELLIAQAKLKTYRQSLLKWAFEGRLTNKNLKDGELPKGWEVRKLGEVGKCVTGNTPPKNDLYNYGEYIPFVKPPQLQDNKISDAPEKLSKKGAELARILPVNSVLITCIGNLGRTALSKAQLATNQQINAIIPKKEIIEGDFLFYQAQSSVFKNQLEDFSSATTVAIVNKSKFETIEIVVPPLPEQQQIVAILESKLTICDAIEETIKTSINKCEALRQSILKKAFLGELLNKKNSVKCP